MHYFFEIADADMCADYDARMTAPGYAGRHPDINQPGEPAEAAEFEITINSVHFVQERARSPRGLKLSDPLELPEWLRIELTTSILDNVPEAVLRGD